MKGEREEVVPASVHRGGEALPKIDPLEILNRFLTENPDFERVLRLLFYRQSLEMGLSMALVFTGVISLVNGLTVLLDLAWKGWVAFGVVALVTGLGLIMRLGKGE